MKKIENKHHNGWIDHRISYKIVFDTETCPLDRGLTEVSPWNMFTYDFGFAVVDKRGKVYEAFSFVNADIFCNEKELMKSAYYASKVPMYWDDIQAGRRTLTSFYNIWKIFNEVIAKYGVIEIYAHNARFDYGTLQNTQRWLTKSKYRYFFDPNIKICDTLKMAKDVMGKMPTYIKFCQENGYATKTGKPRFTAEVLYRFISGDNDFTEAHTGLEDVMIEKEIMAYCFRQHKKMRKLLWED